MTEPDLSPEQRAAKVAELRQQADGALAGLRAQMAAVKQAQQQALSSTGEATSRDGSVQVAVDATGVVTSLKLSPNAFERTTPDKLAQTVVATIQAAAAKARAKVSETLAPVRAQSANVLAAAGSAVGIDAGQLSTPEVPRTATDASDQADPWRQAQAAPPSYSPPPPAAPPAARPAPSQQPPQQQRPTAPSGRDYDDDDGGSVLNEGSW
ncbi:YbaB/EbfC family nucleoid-associated protein [Kutzneria kofuensis]|uniref:DNA-binding protein YbaB n=1 Tax=Kutzneria kofuensis TaxID=103725 RepID=A0A7W9KGZ3_9PSEU|nr:YbaB/EbfC family nucleoid-associated protein [Kutzneria kofuensis]MBB5892409.1 DNA-binding protein YbaB [Kutzneria kofuensis]